MRGSYFGVQNLIYFGVALGPILCGFLLDRAAPSVMFYALVGVAVASWLFYVFGCRAGAPVQDHAASPASTVEAKQESA
jgi:MFS family permease